MPETDIGSAVSSDLTNAMTDYSVAPEVTDGVSDQEETEWMNNDFPQYFGYFNTIPELNRAINAKATWTVGKGFKAGIRTSVILENISGWGKDTFNTILENMIRTYYIGGDAFAEIMRDEEGDVVNLKPLDPAVIKIVVNRQGMIKRYEQVSKIKKATKKFKPEEMFHLARNRVADEIHGRSVIAPVENIILMRNEAMTDWKRVLHRNIDPLWIFHMDTDEPTVIAKFKATQDASRGKGENMYLPKGAVIPELIATATNATLNPLQWIDVLNNYFYEAVGTPKVILGGANEFTEASAKIAYLAFQQDVEEEQLFIEEQVWEQLSLKIELEFPVSLENELLSDKKKDGNMTETKPSETTAGAGQ